MAPVPHYQLACVARTWGYSSDVFKEFLSGYGIADGQLGQIENDLKNLIVLRAMRVAGRAYQKRADDFERVAAKAMSTIIELLKDDFQ